MSELLRVFGWDARLFGSLAVPAQRGPSPIGLVCWGREGYHRVGPSGLWRELGRQAARRRTYCLRFDPCGRGDSEERPEGDLFTRDLDDALCFLASEADDPTVVLVAHGPTIGEAIDAAGRDSRVRGLILLPTARSGHAGDPPVGLPTLSIGLGISERRPNPDRLALPEADGGLLLAADRAAVLAHLFDWLKRTFGDR